MRKLLIYPILFPLIISLSACSEAHSTNLRSSITPRTTQNAEELSNFSVGNATPTDLKKTPSMRATMTPGLTEILPTMLSRNTDIVHQENQPLTTKKPEYTSGAQNFGIMVWNQVTEQKSVYGYFDPEIEMQIDIGRLKVPVGSLAPDPNQSVSLSFSPNTNKIAYFTKDTGIELWISDLKLTSIKRVWKDDKDSWLGDIGSKNDVLITWGINDRYLVVSSILKKDHLLVVDLIAGEYWEILGKCNWIKKSLISGQLVVGCTSTQQGREEFKILDSDGVVTLDATTPPLVNGIIFWSYSRDATRILYISDDNKIGILGPDENLIYLHLTFEMDSSLSLTWRKNLQWSQDGRRVLVYGLEPLHDLCPTQRDAGVHNKNTQRSCWFVLDSVTGKIVWWPKDNIQAKIDIPWDYLRNEYDASLSPDGEWISSTYTDSRMGHAYYLLAVSLLNDEVMIIALEQAQTIFWP